MIRALRRPVFLIGLAITLALFAVALLSLVWAPVDFVRLSANYGKLWIDDSPVAALTGERDYTADTFGIRTQVDF